MKKHRWLLVLGVVGCITALTGVPELIEGIRARGAGGVNYGRIVFPLLIGVIAFWQYRKHREV